MIVVIGMYLSQVVQAKSEPNPAAWLIAAITAVLNSITYILAVDGDWIKGSITIVTAIGITVIFGFSWKAGKFAPLQLIDKLILGVCTIGGVLWILIDDPRVSHLIMQSAMCLSFVPIVWGIWKRTLREHPTAWSIAITAYMITILSIFWNFDDNWASLAFPFFNGVLGNGAVAISCIIQNHRFPRPN